MKSIYEHVNWGRLQERKESGVFKEYVYKQDGIKIIYPFIKRLAGVVNGKKYYDLVTPRGQSGIRIEGYSELEIVSVIREFDIEFKKYCEENNIIAELIRFSPWSTSLQYFSQIYTVEKYGDVYVNNLKEDFFQQEYNAKRRNQIRKAINNNVEVKFENSIDAFVEFLEDYSFTRTKYQISDYYELDLEFLVNYRKLLGDNVYIARAVYEGEVISSAIILLGEDIAHYHFSTSNNQYNSLNGNSLLLYKTAIWAKEKGKTFFDLGSAKKESPLSKFKMSISNPYPFYSGKKIRNKQIYNELLKRKTVVNKEFFPEYRG